MKLREKILKSVGTVFVKGLLKILPHTSNFFVIQGTYIAEFFASNKIAREAVQGVRKLFQQGHASIKLTKNILRKINPKCRQKIAGNFIINSMLLGTKIRDDYYTKNKIRPPFLILFSPTMRCNLRCKGCYAAKYDREEELSLELLDRVIKEAKEMGIYFFTILGGEPFIRPDLFKLYEKHSDVFFQVYTNGTLIDPKTAQKIAGLGNILPIISLEGCEGSTDSRRGEGIYQKVISAMKNLREAGVPFGNSVTVSSDNFEAITSDSFIDFLIEAGSFLVWYFLYMPVGEAPDVSKIPTAEQRNQLRLFTRKTRDSRPIFVADFWNDAPYVGGCIAGGRRYFHINHKGDVEPCIFAHFAADNIKNKSLKEVLNSTYFQAIRRRQPFSQNLLMPCMLIDSPQVFREIVAETSPVPTHPEAEYLLNELATFLDDYSRNQKNTFSEIWEKEYLPKLKYWKKHI